MHRASLLAAAALGAALLCALTLQHVAAASSPVALSPRAPNVRLSLAAAAAPRSASTCDVCVQFALTAINELLNIIANAGILGSCADLCGKLPKQIEADVCDALCAAVGIDEFVRILEKEDLDPVWYCQLVDACLVEDCNGTCVTIREWFVDPAQIHEDQKVVAFGIFTVLTEVGAGMLRLSVVPPSAKDMPQDSDSLVAVYEPGTYSLKAEIDTAGAGMQPGEWGVQLWLCEGMCGAIHPHTQTLAVGNASFVLLP